MIGFSDARIRLGIRTSRTRGETCRHPSALAIVDSVCEYARLRELK